MSQSVGENAQHLFAPVEANGGASANSSTTPIMNETGSQSKRKRELSSSSSSTLKLRKWDPPKQNEATEPSFKVTDWAKAGTFHDYYRSIKPCVNGAGIYISEKLPLGIPINVNIVGVIDKPPCIFVQTKSQADKVEQFKRQLKSHFLLVLLTRGQIFERGYVVVMHNDDLFRGQIESFDFEHQKWWVRLVDIGLRIVKGIGELYQLPPCMLTIKRQVVGVMLTSIRPLPSEDWWKRGVSYLQSLLIGNTQYRLLVERTTASLSHYKGELMLIGKHRMSKEIRAKCNKNYLNSSFLPRLHRGYVLSVLPVKKDVDVKINHVESPDEIYVHLVSPEAQKEEHDLAKKVVGVGSYMCYDGTRLCVAPPNDTIPGIQGFRAACKAIDFTVEPPTATIFLIDYGFTYQIPLQELKGITPDLIPVKEQNPTLAYCVKISVDPATEKWSKETQDSLLDIMKYSKSGGQVTLRRVKSGKLILKHYVELRLGCCSLDWGHALLDIREAKVKMNPLVRDGRSPLERAPNSSFSNWKKHFNAGYLTESRLLEKISNSALLTERFEQFKNKAICLKGKVCRFLVCGLSPSATFKEMLIVSAIPFPWITNELLILKSQLEDYYQKVIDQAKLEDASVFPVVVGLRETAQRQFNSATCQWHRCVYKAEDKYFLCADCLKVFKLDANGKANGFEIRHLCAEMLEIQPLGMKLTVNLRDGDNSPQPGNIIRVHFEGTEDYLPAAFHSKRRLPVAAFDIIQERLD